MKEKEQALFKYAKETLPTSDKEILGLLVLSFIFTLTSKVAVPEAKIQEVIFGFTFIFTYFFIIKTFYNVYKKSILFEYLGPLFKLESHNTQDEQKQKKAKNKKQKPKIVQAISTENDLSLENQSDAAPELNLNDDSHKNAAGLDKTS